MTTTKCYSVRLESFRRISEKCYKAVAFDGSEALIPASQFFGEDHEVQKGNAYWISAWILEKKDLQYSSKKVAYFDYDKNKLNKPTYSITKHIPEHVDSVLNNEIEELKK